MKPLLAFAAMFAGISAAQTWSFEESGTALAIRTPAYVLTIAREGAGLKLERAGEAVLESAQPRSFENRAGAASQVGKFKSVARTPEAVTLEFETTLKDASALFEIRPHPDSVSITEWVMAQGAELTSFLAFRLAPSGLWYGGGFQGWRDPQVFPLNEARISGKWFLADGNTQGTPAWYTTKGVAVWIRTPHDFRYWFENGLFRASMPAASAITYDILAARDIREVSLRMIRAIGLARSVPPAEYFHLPIYTTWVEHKVETSQARVLEYAQAIHDHNLPCGVIEIDDKWEDRYGDMRFDPKKFPQPKAMVDRLHALGYRVTLWVHPFVNTDSATFTSDARLLLKDPSGRTGLIRWWNGNAGVWDFTNPAAGAAFRGRLTRLQKEYGLDGFKFDGGDGNLVPRDLRSMKPIGPAEYADIYNREATAHFAWEETRVGIYSQPLGIVQRLIDKHSVWGRENGLAAILPEAITVSMRGFPFVMPDMIGGNQYDDDRIGKELLIRWAQASALMPLMQFSWGPWHFDDEAVRLSREASRMHMRFSPFIVTLAEAAQRTGEPILRPLWFNFPDDRECAAITDQFMLGEEVVIAPVTAQGAVRRDVYLPRGRWRDDKNGKLIEGGRWVKNHPAPLDTLPLFIREGSRAGQ